MKNTDEIWEHVDRHREGFVRLADQVFDTPETLYAEFRSAAVHSEALRAHGFRVREAPAGLPTAVIGEAGEEGPVIAILVV